jgi:outer membrane protein assembly factor BamB
MWTVLILAVAVTAHGDVTGWRGNGSGQFDDTPAPLTWSASEGIAWKTAMPEWANGCPILVAGRLYVTAEPDRLLCLSATDGSVIWEQANPRSEALPAGERAAYAAKSAAYEKLAAKRNELKGKLRGIGKQLSDKPANAAELKAEKARLKAEKEAIDQKSAPLQEFARPRTHGVNGYATPTPVSDGTYVYGQFGDGIVACYTLTGQRKWIRYVAPSKHGWGHSASPILVADKLIVHIADTVHALRVADGQTVWSTQSGSKWGTPMGFRVGDQWAVLTTGGDVLRASDGRVVAREIASLPWSSPIAEGNTLYVVDEREAKALRIPDAMADELTFEALWSMKPERNRYYATPLFIDGLLYAIHRSGTLTVIDATSGDAVYTRKLPLGGTVYPSPFLAGGNIYVSSDTGKTIVIKPGRTYEELASNSLEGFRSTPIADAGRVYVRGLEHLYCIKGVQP